MILDIADDAIISLGGDQHITLFNKGAERIFGYTQDEALGRPLDMLLPARFTEDHRRNVEAFVALPTVARTMGERQEVYGLRKDGSEFPAEASISKLVIDGKPVVTVILRDITERKRAEEEVLQLLIREQLAHARAEAAARAREDLLLAVSHDLKNLLVIIKGYGQLLRRRAVFSDALGSESRRMLARIDVTSTRMNQQIEELLDFANMQAGGPLVLARCHVDLVALARRVISDYQSTTQLHMISLQTSTPRLAGFWDPDRLERVLANLLSNAIKYSPSVGEITVTVDKEVGSGATWVVLGVRDEGIGIPASDLSRIFELFQRGSNVGGMSVSGGLRGTGIGLASALRIVEQHGGTMSVESSEGAGSTFTVRLPLVPPRRTGD